MAPEQTRQPGSAVRTEWRRPRVLLAAEILVVAGLIFLAYSNHFHNSFHFDDSHTIVNNVFIRDLRNIPRFFRDATTFSSLPSNRSYRPLLSTSLALDYGLAGSLDPFWFQLSGFIYFLAETGLLALVIKGLLDLQARHERNGFLAVAAAGLYALHPATADTVNYIIARSEILSTLAVLGSFACYQWLPRTRPAGLFSLPAAIGTLAKPPAAMFAPLFAAYVLLFPDTRPGRRVLAIGSSFVLCAAAILFVSHMTPKEWTAGAASNAGYLLTQPYVALLYFRTFLWPDGLSADYDLEPVRSAGEPRFWIGMFFVAMIVCGSIFLAWRPKTRVVGFGLIWFILALLPTSLLPLAEVMNDHRTFFAYAGLVIALAGVAQIILSAGLMARPFVAGAACCMVLVLFCGSAYATWQRNKVWKDEESLWLDVSIKSPRNGRGLMNYANTRMAKSDFVTALAYYHRAEQLAPNYSFLMINLGIAEGATGHGVEAERYFLRALQLNPAIPDCYTYYARWLITQGRASEALPMLRKALALSPGDITAQDSLTLALNQTNAPATRTPEYYLGESQRQYWQQNFVASIAAANQALKLRPGYAEAWNNIGAAYNSMGQYDAAIAALRKALELKPDFPLAQRNLDFANQMRERDKR